MECISQFEKLTEESTDDESKAHVESEETVADKLPVDNRPLSAVKDEYNPLKSDLGHQNSSHRDRRAN